MIRLLIGCSLFGTVLLIGICALFPNTNSPMTSPHDNPSSIATEEPFYESQHFNHDKEETPSVNWIDDDLRATLREHIASSSIQVLRSRGMSDEEIKSELLRDFSLTEEQVDEMLEVQK